MRRLWDSQSLTDGVKLKDNFLQVKRAMFGRGASIQRVRKENAPSREQQEKNNGPAPCDRGGRYGVAMVQRSHVGGVRGVSYMDALQRGETDRWFREEERQGVLFDSRVSQCFHGRLIWCLSPMREVWIKCLGVPLHARCAKTLSIGQKWGEVLMVEFGSLENGVLDNGRIKIFTDVVTHFFFDFKLLVDGDEFDCWVVEDGSVTSKQRQGYRDPPRSFGSEQSWEDQRIPGLVESPPSADSL
ncbi:hypothetical protein Dimus_016935 [Dionaea muscipula]